MEKDMTKVHDFELVPGIAVGRGGPPVIFAGPCVIEDEAMCLEIAHTMREICEKLGLPYVFKASFDKANRTSVSSFRGPGLKQGLDVFRAVKRETGVPVITDLHEARQVYAVAEVVDVLQIPAFLCRQTDLLLAAGESGLPVNVKKGQFLAPEDMSAVLAKIQSTGNRRILFTERGTTFGYHNLVVDMRGLVIMRNLGAPVVFDCTHAVQLPGGQGGSSGGQREFIQPLARAAAAIGIDGLFLEVHPDPSQAKSDGPNSIPTAQVEQMLRKVKAIHEAGKQGKEN